MNWRKAMIIGVVAVLELSAVALMVSLRLPGRAAVAAAPPVPTPVPVAQRRVVVEEPTPTLPPPAPAPPVPVAERRRIPVLMYHEITAGPNALYVPKDEFAGHVRWLKANGYTAITLQQLSDYYTEGKPVPPKPVVLTFDDGYVSYYENALPVLQEAKWPGTLFVITSYVGKPGFVTWDQVRDAAGAGTEIGSHTVSHPSLELLSGKRLVQEIAESRAELERQIGKPIHFFCYPAGKWNQETVRVVREAGYIGAVTTKPGLAAPDQDSLLWERIRINQGLSPQGLGSLLHNYGL